MKRTCVSGLLKTTGGFTLLEILVALILIAITVTVMFQLFSKSLGSLSASDDYAMAAIKAQEKMREVLEDEELKEGEVTENSDDGYRYTIRITSSLDERTRTLGVQLFEIAMMVTWTAGTKEKSLGLTTMKVVERKL